LSRTSASIDALSTRTGGGGARPFYDLLCLIADREFGHIEFVAATINTMLTGATPVDDLAPTPPSRA
jgi:Mn-containing catalase